jgi:hypothetical protein
LYFRPESNQYALQTGDDDSSSAPPSTTTGNGSEIETLTAKFHFVDLVSILTNFFSFVAAEEA